MNKLNKKITICILTLLVITFVSVKSSTAADFHVDKNNTTGTQDGTITHPYNTIQAAIDTALSGDTVKVASGTYPENISVQDKTLNILGGYASGSVTFNDRNPATNITHIQGDGTDAVVTLNYSGQSVIDGFRITGGTGNEGEDPDPEFYAGGGIF